LQVWTRSGGVSSRRIELNTDEGLQLFWRIFTAYFRMEPQQLGYSELSKKPTTIGLYSVDVGWTDEIDRDRAIVSRGTTCWAVSPLHPKGPPLVLKDSWQYSERTHEGDLLAMCQKRNVKGVVGYLAHCENEIPSVHAFLGEKILNDARPMIEKSVTPSDVPTRKRTSDSCSQTGSIKRSRTASSRTSQSAATSLQVTSQTSFVQPSPIPIRSPDDPFAEEPEIEYMASSTSRTAIPNRLHTRVLIERGIPVTKWRDQNPGPLTLLRCIRDAIRGHYSLLTEGRILHRDISINNIMISESGRKDGYKGFLIDLDLALELGPQPVAACGAPERTGTFEFLSIEALESDPTSSSAFRRDFRHCYYDDLQSFFYVFLYLCTETPSSPLLTAWRAGCTPAAHAKRALLAHSALFQEFLDGLYGECRARWWRDMLWNLRNILFPGHDLVDRNVLKSDDIMRTMYERIDHAFVEAITREEENREG
jgi:hypothetical protein